MAAITICRDFGAPPNKVMSVCLNGAENDAWPWIGEKPAPLTRLKAGSSQGDGRNQGVQAWVCGCVCVHVQSCLTLCESMGCSPPGSSVHGIIPARTLEWVAMFQGIFPPQGSGLGLGLGLG